MRTKHSQGSYTFTRGKFRALTQADGEQPWQTTTPPMLNNAVPDAFGGLIVTTCPSGSPLTVTDLGTDGQPIWEVQSAEVSGYGYICYAPQIAIDGNGVAYIAEPTNAGLPSVTYAYPSGYTSSFQFQPSTVNNTDIDCCVGPPMVNIDGTMYVEYEVRTTSNNVITSDTLYLYDSAAGPYLLSSTTQNEALLPGPIIPDGDGGLLATWTISPASGPPPQYPFQVADFSGGAVGTPYNLPFSPTTVSFGQSPTLVLGQSGVAFATDGTDPVNGPLVASFNVSNGSVNWTYQASPGDTLSIIQATSDGGVTINDANAGGILQLSSSGAPPGMRPSSSLPQAAVPVDLGNWISIASGILNLIWSPDGTNGVPTTLAQSVYPLPAGDTHGHHRPPFCQMTANNCVLAPSSDQTVPNPLWPGVNTRQVTYQVFSLQNGTLTPAINNSQVQGTKIAVYESNPTNPLSGICSWGSNLLQDTNTCQETGGEYTDDLTVGNTGPNTVLQQFFADRGQVQVFWPTDGFNSQGFPIKTWYGAWNQNATTSAKLGGVITQNNANTSNGASCPTGCSPIQANNTN